ncbi:MAG: leucine-rich repeat domain-containing protein [Bacteroidaceae bacterium]
MNKNHLITIILALSCELTSLTLQAQNISRVMKRSFNIEKAGLLQSKLTQQEAKGITQLTLSGRINARDFRLMRDSLLRLEVLDLSSATISSMAGKGGTTDESFIIYVKNTIPEYAFCTEMNGILQGKQTLREVWLPNATINIDKNAFANCPNLKLIVIRKKTAPNLMPGALNDSLTAIFVPLGCRDEYRNHKGWAEFNIMESTPIRCEVHLNSPGTLGDELLKMGNQPSDVNYLTITGRMDENDLKLVRAYMPKLVGINLAGTTVKFLPDYLFSQKKFLMEVILPDNLERIGQYAFSGCARLNGTIVIPPQVTEIGEGAFLDCNRLRFIKITGKKLVSIGDNLFRSNDNRIKYIH